MRLVALVVAALAVGACHRPVEPVEPSNDAPSSSCVSRCGHLRAFGCAEGKDLDACSAACTAADGTHMGKTIDWDCVDRAQSVEAVQHCGLRLCIPR